jgi:hypothetical protein
MLPGETNRLGVQDKILRFLRLLGSHQQWLMVLIDWKVSMMKIVRSTSSCALAGESNETREAVRSGEIQAKGVVLPDDDGVSPNPERGELVSASLNNYRRPTFPRWRSLLSTGKKRTVAPVEPVGVRAVGAHQKNHHVTLGDPLRPPRQRQLVLEIHNQDRAWTGVRWARSSKETG